MVSSATYKRNLYVERRVMRRSFAFRRVAAAQLAHAHTAMQDHRLTAGGSACQESLFQLLGGQFRLHSLQPYLEFGLLRVESNEFELSGDLGYLVLNSLGTFLL